MTASLFDLLEPTQGRTRSTDPQTSVVGARRARVATQRRMIAAHLARCPWVTADQMHDADLRPDRSERGTWASRLAGLKKDGLLTYGELVPGRNQKVVSYVLTSSGREWRDALLRETT